MGAKRDFALIKHRHAFGDLLGLDLTGLADNSLLQYDLATDTWEDVTVAGLNGQLDHGTLLGLADDDHTQYHTDARALTWLGTRSTTDLAEGSNLYFTNERVDDRTAALIQNGTGISWAYNDTLGTLTPTVSLSAFSTSNLAEGSNLYFTDERAQDAVFLAIADSTSIDVTYNDAGNSFSLATINANPSGLIGMSAVNGTAATPLRSDGRHAIDPAIVPTWTGIHTFSATGTFTRAPTSSLDGGILLSSTAPLIGFNETGAGTDGKVWDWVPAANIMRFRIANDAGGSQKNYLAVTRSGLAVTAMEYGNSTDNPTHSFNGKINVAADGRLSGTALHNTGTVTGTTNQYIASGTYTPTLTNTANISSSTAHVCQWVRVGNVVTVSGYFDATCTAAANTSTTIGISLPIASALTAAEHVGGVGSSGAAARETLLILADFTNDRATATWGAATTISDARSFTFTYLVL